MSTRHSQPFPPPQKISFNRPYISGRELFHITMVCDSLSLAGNGEYTKRCHEWLEAQTGCHKALLTHSCSAALEMSALLADIQPGDEVIMSSYTFSSTANAFVLRGGVPVFVDIRSDTLNIDERLIEAAITPRTKAIVPMHYAGVSCEMDTIMTIASQYGLKVIEDAAQGLMASYKGRALGSIGDLGTFSFHETKNITSGEGGALLVNDPELTSRAEIIREKGTDRSRFLRGEVDKYTWQDVGSSFLPSELISAFLWGQLENADEIFKRRMENWNYYHDKLVNLETREFLRRPIIPDHCEHNAHMYYILLRPEFNRGDLLKKFKDNEIYSTFHYVPLHLSPAGKRYCRTSGSMHLTEAYSDRLVRLPLWSGLASHDQDRILDVLEQSAN